MDWSQIYLDTFIPELPKYWNQNFQAFKRYLDVFYDENRGILIRPLETTGRVKGARGEFVTAVVDNLIVRNQFTNLYENTTTADADFVNIYTGGDASTRDAIPFLNIEDSSALDASVYNWPYEPSTFSWIDVNKPYYKINNDVSIAFQNNNLGQEFQIIFNLDVSTTNPYTILLGSSIDPCIGDASIGIQTLSVTYSDASIAWIKLITVSYDSSMGPVWVVKQSGGSYSIENYTIV